MDKRFAQLVENIRLTGNIYADMNAFLAHHGHPETIEHSMRVAGKSKELALRFGEDAQSAEIAGWLHDISAIFPFEQRIRIAGEWGVDVLPAEEIAPMIIHQKLSAVMTREIFGVENEAILSAIGCHTTLKANATGLDKVVFVADKIEWDQEGYPPYLKGILAALEESLERAALHYLEFLWQRRDALSVIHPWFVSAYRQLSGIMPPESVSQKSSS